MFLLLRLTAAMRMIAIRFFKSQTTVVVSLLVFIQAPAHAQLSANYCVSLRGNGFRPLAHVGALAQVVEAIGAPSGMAGGSSSTLTMYLADQIFQNPFAQQDREKTAFLFKIVDPLLNELLKRPEIETAKRLLTNVESQERLKKILEQMKGASGIKALTKIVKMYFSESVFRDFVSLVLSRTFKTLVNSKATDNIIFSKNLIKMLNANASEFLGRELAKEELQALKAFRATQFQESLDGLLSFKVSADANFLFREGLLRQQGMAEFLEPIARFLRVKNFDQATHKYYRKFLEKCSAGSKGLTWSEINDKNPSCEKDLTSLARGVFAEHELYYHWKENKVSDQYKDRKTIRFNAWTDLSLEKIGKSMPMFGMSSLLKNESANEFIQFNKNYMLTTDKNFGFGFETDAKGFGVGYWGQQASLQQAQKNLSARQGFTDSLGRFYNFSQDEKSKRFTNLGEASWEELMYFSAAEPGQGSARTTTDVYGQTVVTTGGWFDHLSAPLLKASGCDHVVAITRDKGDTRFGQEVYARMLFNGGKTVSEITDALVQIGDKDDQTSLWSKLFNIKNPNSSLNFSLHTTDVVICSFWDDLPTNSPGSEIFNAGYRAGAYFERSDSAISKASWLGKIIEKTDDIVDRTTGVRLYSGCIPE